MNMGMALGLFAIFSIIRYRSENLVAKHLAYLFTVITISVINAMFDFPHPVRGIVLVNLVIIVTVLFLELGFSKFSKDILTKEEKKALKKAGKNTEKKEAKKAGKKKYSRHQVLYDNLGLLSLDKKNDLLMDISKRTGIEVDKVRIRKIDLINSNVILDVYYKETSDKAEE
jgi:Ca2+/Na+ antiporter